MARLARQFEEISGQLTDGHDGPPSPERVVDLALEALGGDAACGVLLVRAGRRPVVAARTDEWVEEIELLQVEVGEGPCIEACEASVTVACDDLGDGGRWPSFAERVVAECGARSALSVPLRLSDDDRGALGFYSRSVGRFDEIALGIAAMLAPFAGLAVESSLHVEDAANLGAALRSSRQIGTAIGILMARERVTSEAAFDQLVEASQHLNRKLRDIAVEVTETGQLPPTPDQRQG